MKLSNLKKMTMAAVFSVAAILGTSEVANAQYGDRYYDKAARKQQQRIEKQQRKLERQQQRYETMRYRVYRNGNYYNTDQRGAQMLQQAVNYGYQQGFRAGQNDASRRTRYGYNNQNTYRSGNYGYQNGVDQSQYRYYFQQGFQKGYEDGFYRRNQYGNNNGTNILSSILSTILNIQQY